MNVTQELGAGSQITTVGTGGLDEPIFRSDGQDSQTLLADAVGSVIASADSEGVVRTRYLYEPFGRTATVGDASDNEAKFTGREEEGAGLYYYRARFYDPELGRFTSEDPIGFAGGLNLFAYAAANPVSYTDPLGLDAIKIEYFGYPITVPGRNVQLPLGHAAVVAVDEKTGRTKYFEYGRYDSDFGNVQSPWIPNVVIGDNGLPTPSSLSALYDYLSANPGKGSPVLPTYYDDADFQKVVDFATRRMKDPNRKPYSWNPLAPNHCFTFADEAIAAGRPSFWDRLIR
jgi:RHS repeat-associated protein